jgi:5-carboxymethyl-2-hydroxymuconate isomerase
VIEYSANIEERLDLTRFIDTVHAAAIETGIFPLKGTRTRAERRDNYKIADGHPDNAFVHVTAFIGHGRTLAVKKAAGEALFAAITEYLKPLYDASPLGISFVMQEMDPVLSFKQNNLPEWIAQRNAET